MYREQVLRSGIISVGLLMCVFFWNASVGGEIVPHASPRVIFRTDNSGMGFLYATPGTKCRWHDSENLRNREYSPESTQSDDALAAFYATDMTVGLEGRPPRFLGVWFFAATII
jgi:hypothetical protein